MADPYRIILTLVCRIAMLGGFLARKSDGQPGVKALCQSFSRVSNFVTGLEKIEAIHAI